MMDELDGNLHALQKHQSSEEQLEALQAEYIESIQPQLIEIQELLQVLRHDASHGHEYDMSGELEYELEGIL